MLRQSLTVDGAQGVLPSATQLSTSEWAPVQVCFPSAHTNSITPRSAFWRSSSGEAPALIRPAVHPTRCHPRVLRSHPAWWCPSVLAENKSHAFTTGLAGDVAVRVRSSLGLASCTWSAHHLSRNSQELNAELFPLCSPPPCGRPTDTFRRSSSRGRPPIHHHHHHHHQIRRATHRTHEGRDGLAGVRYITAMSPSLP